MYTNISLYPALQLFNRLLPCPSPSGREEKLSVLIQEEIKSLGFSPKKDSMGNLYVEIKGKDPEAPLCLIAAHMDEISVVVNKIEEDGRLRVQNSGGLHYDKLGERPLEFLGDYENIIAVTSLGSAHTKVKFEKPKTWDDVYVITGLSPEQLSKAGIRPGTSGVPVHDQRGMQIFGDPQRPLVAA